MSEGVKNMVENQIWILSLCISVIAIFVSVYSTWHAKISFDLVRKETIEKNVNEFIIKNKEGIGFLPQCAALEVYPLTHIFSRQIFDNYEYLTDAEKKFLFDEYNIKIPVKISKTEIRKGIDILLDNMVSNRFMTECQRLNLNHKYIHSMLNFKGRISNGIKNYSAPYVGVEFELSKAELSINQGKNEIMIKNYIFEFLKGTIQETPFNKIYGKYSHDLTELIIRLVELCYYSLTELDAKSSIKSITNDMNIDFVYYEDIVLMLAVGSYLAYVHEGIIPEPNLFYDMTTYSKAKDSEFE